jgi:hypothetical protein
MSNANWPRIKEILEGALERWKLENGREPKMKASHEGNIGWETKEELAASAPYGKQLIDTDKVGNGRAYETNLVKIFRGPIGGYRRMPSGGPYLSSDEIGEIVDWIDAGIPD